MTGFFENKRNLIALLGAVAAAVLALGIAVGWTL